MYRAYVKKQSSKFSDVDVKQLTEDLYENVDVKVKETVQDLWDIIEKQCNPVMAKDVKESKMQLSSSKSDWKIVRVFVSSTFSDFFNEREVLVKKVFPELREWCKSRNLKLIECDLRWGVPKDSSTAETIMICLEEIDKCINANEGQPFFVTLLGDRYGWIPPIGEVPDQAKKEYEWVEGTSITCMEILHGAYRTKNPNAGFFVRDVSVYKDIPESKQQRFVDEDPLHKHHVQVLKDKIKSAFPNQTFDYEVSYKKLSTNLGKERVELTGYDTFASSILDFLKSSITKMYPDQSCEELDVFTKEQEAQWFYVLDQANNLIGRQEEKAILVDYLSHGSSNKFEQTTDASSSIRCKEDWDLFDDDQPVCVLEAPGGWGKSTLLCSVIKEAVQNGLNIFYHIVGSTSSSNNVETLLKRLLRAFRTNLTETDADKAIIEQGNISDLKKLLRKYLMEFRAQSQDKLILLIDGINELDTSETLAHLSWLPPTLPGNIRCIVSTNQHLPTLSRLYEHATLKLVLAAMTKSELSSIAEHYLSTFSKKLDAEQLESFISYSKVDNPLWLTLMAEELRIFGDFTLVDKRISHFPSTMEELLIQIIDRLIAEDQEQGLVKKILCLIACSGYGLPTDKARQICGDIEAKEEVAHLYWLQMQRILKPYLRIGGFLEETVKFSHEAVQLAVFKHLLSSESEIQHWHTVLADFYQYWSDDGRLKAFHLPRHLKRARLHKRIAIFIRTDKDAYRHMHAFQRSDLLQEARCRSLADPVMPYTSPMMLCHFCAVKRGGFNVACHFSNDKCCVLCSDLCHQAKTTKAYACAQHSNRRGRDMVKCALCNSSVSTKGSSGGSAALLCTHCAFGVRGKTCSCLAS